jgi:hypothetical protein
VADGVGVEPCPCGPRSFSRRVAPHGAGTIHDVTFLLSNEYWNTGAAREDRTRPRVLTRDARSSELRGAVITIDILNIEKPAVGLEPTALRLRSARTSTCASRAFRRRPESNRRLRLRAVSALQADAFPLGDVVILETQLARTELVLMAKAKHVANPAANLYVQNLPVELAMRLDQAAMQVHGGKRRIIIDSLNLHLHLFEKRERLNMREACLRALTLLDSPQVDQDDPVGKALRLVVTAWLDTFGRTHLKRMPVHPPISLFEELLVVRAA